MAFAVFWFMIIVIVIDVWTAANGDALLLFAWLIMRMNFFILKSLHVTAMRLSSLCFSLLYVGRDHWERLRALVCRTL